VTTITNNKRQSTGDCCNSEGPLTITLVATNSTAQLAKLGNHNSINATLLKWQNKAWMQFRGNSFQQLLLLSTTAMASLAVVSATAKSDNQQWLS